MQILILLSLSGDASPELQTKQHFQAFLDYRLLYRDRISRPELEERAQLSSIIKTESPIRFLSWFAVILDAYLEEWG